jgi:TP901-1 family phage major tail protein
MAAQQGLLFLLKVGAAAVLTARQTDMTINSEMVDVTAKDTAGWRDLMDGAGMKSMTITLEGPFKDATYEETLRGYAHAGSINAYTLESENGDSWAGNFQITSYSRAGTYNGEETYSMTLESAGVITFTAGT